MSYDTVIGISARVDTAFVVNASLRSLDSGKSALRFSARQAGYPGDQGCEGVALVLWDSFSTASIDRVRFGKRNALRPHCGRSGPTVGLGALRPIRLLVFSHAESAMHELAHGGASGVHIGFGGDDMRRVNVASLPRAAPGFSYVIESGGCFMPCRLSAGSCIERRSRSPVRP